MSKTLTKKDRQTSYRELQSRQKARRDQMEYRILRSTRLIEKMDEETDE